MITMMKRWLARVVVLLAVIVSFIVLSAPRSASAYGNRNRHQVVFVVCDYLQLQDLDSPELKYLRRFFNNGGIALLNTNTAGSRTRPNAAATVSAGKVALGTVQETLAFGPKENYLGENPLALFQARTGYRLDQGNLVVLDLPIILRANETDQVKARPGTLGESLHKKGLLTGVLGNADLPGLPQRSMAVIAMDRRGVIDRGDISGDLLRIDQNSALVYSTNYPALKSEYLKLKNRCNFLVIELGDLVRLEQSKQNLTDKIYLKERNRILREYDEFLGWLLQNTSLQKTRVMVASLIPTNQSSGENRFFGFIGMLGDQLRPGLLISPTTRRAGIVTLYDIAPSVCNYLKAPSDSFEGRPWHVEPRADSLDYIRSVEARTAFISLLRPPFVKGYVILHLVVLASIIFCLSLKPRMGKYLSPVLLGLISVPVVWLLVSGLPLVNTLLYVILCLSLIAIVVFMGVGLARNKDLDPILFLCLITVATLLGDTVCGGTLQKYSVLSYDPMSGARFYGMGNEYMGVLIGALVMGSSLLIQRMSGYVRLPRLLTGILFLSACVVLGAPMWGSNFGGLLAALTAFTYTFFRFMGIRLRWKYVLIGGLVIIVLASCFILWDIMRPPELRSHFGQLIANIQIGGFSVFEEIVVRKLAMNYRLIKYTIWTRVLLGTLLALGILFYRPVGIFRKVLFDNPAVAIGLEGSLIGAFAALVFNDSGIVAAATAIIFPAATLFFLVLKQHMDTVSG